LGSGNKDLECDGSRKRRNRGGKKKSLVPRVPASNLVKGQGGMGRAPIDPQARNRAPGILSWKGFWEGKKQDEKGYGKKKGMIWTKRKEKMEKKIAKGNRERGY